MNACPTVPTGGEASLAGTLASIDCQLNDAVGIAYGRLFGHSGTFAMALTLLLTIYVAVMALGLIGGRMKLSLSGAMPRVLALGLVLTFATAWPAYQTVATDLLSRGPDQIASAVLSGNSDSATQVFAHRLDRLFARHVELARSLQSQGKDPSANLQMSAKLAWASALLLVLSTAGLLVMVRIVLAILLALGPVFIVFALFRSTRGLFEGWLKSVVAFALAPLLLVLGGAGLIALLSPLLDSAMDDPATAGEAVQPLAMLFVAAVVYVLTLAALFWAAISLTRGWRTHGSAPEISPSEHIVLPTQTPSASRTSTANPLPANAAVHGNTHPRAIGIAAALGRIPTAAVPSIPDSSNAMHVSLRTAVHRPHQPAPRWSRTVTRAARRSGGHSP